MTDEALMERVRAGDRSALQELFQRHERPLYDLFLRLSGHPEDAEDLAMETLLRVFRNAERFRGGSFTAWLYRMALNAARDRARRRSRRREVSASGLEEWDTLEDAAGGRPEAALLRSDLGAQVRAALGEMPEKERQVLVLREYQQLSYQEIAAATGFSLPAVKMLILRARRRLRDRLETKAAPVLAEVCP